MSGALIGGLFRQTRRNLMPSTTVLSKLAPLAPLSVDDVDIRPLFAAIPRTIMSKIPLKQEIGCVGAYTIVA